MILHNSSCAAWPMQWNLVHKKIGHNIDKSKHYNSKVESYYARFSVHPLNECVIYAELCDIPWNIIIILMRNRMLSFRSVDIMFLFCWLLLFFFTFFSASPFLPGFIFFHSSRISPILVPSRSTPSFFLLSLHSLYLPLMLFPCLSCSFSASLASSLHLSPRSCKLLA